MEVHHAILYEGWQTNGKRVSLRQPTVIMTTEAIQTFWDEVQATAANTYSLEKRMSLQTVMEVRDTQLNGFKQLSHSRNFRCSTSWIPTTLHKPS